MGRKLHRDREEEEYGGEEKGVEEVCGVKGLV
jgi:hypothetical protein